MRTRLLSIWYSLTSSLWFVPAIMVSVAVAASFATRHFDRGKHEGWVKDWGLTYGGTAEGAREVLSTISGSMITVAGVVFSITMLVMAQASSQFGPRLLKTFMRDTANQVVLGTFVSTFIYCILILRGVRSESGAEFVPAVSVNVALFLGLASLGVLIYFIHHVSESIQAPNVIAVVNRDLHQSVDRMFPRGIGRSAQEVQSDEQCPANFEAEAEAVPAAKDGYIRRIDGEHLLELCSSHDLVLRLLHRPGQFLIRTTSLALAWPGDRVDEKMKDEVNHAIIVGPYRTLEQDVEFAVDQMVEIAVRALSPGINDTFTALTCVDQLGQALAELADRDLPSPLRYDEHGRLRLITSSVTFAGVTDAAFNLVRQNSTDNVAVTIRLLETIAAVAERARPEMLGVLLHHATMIERASQRCAEESDRRAIRERFENVTRIAAAQPGKSRLGSIRDVCTR